MKKKTKFVAYVKKMDIEVGIFDGLALGYYHQENYDILKLQHYDEYGLIFLLFYIKFIKWH